jgi:hypothetical protein
MDAIQFNGNSNAQKIEKFIGKELDYELESETAYVAGVAPPTFSLLFETPNGTIKIMKGDWIIKDSTGYFSHCTNDVFQQNKN